MDVHVAHLRAKIDDRLGERLIATVRGVGYVIREMRPKVPETLGRREPDL